MKSRCFFLAVISLMILLAACTTPPVMTSQVPEAQSTSTPHAAPGPTLTPPPAIPGATPSPTLDHQSYWATWLASRPRDMESYGKVLDLGATAELPPRESVSMPIWGDHLPLRVLDHTPRFIASEPFPVKGNVESALKDAHCSNLYGQMDCAADSPLLTFGCERIASASGSFPALTGDQQVIAVCLQIPPDENEDRENYLYRGGCAFRRDAGLILEQDRKYELIETPTQVKALLLPIDSPEKALTYLEMMTGLTASYFPEADPLRLYFVDPIEGTRVEEKDGSYRVNLFHFQRCLCEPWLNSRVDLQVDRQGKITWMGASPISMTIGMSCAD